MESKEVSAEQILECSLLPLILLKTYEMETTLMGFHVYKTSWNPYVGEEVRAVMQPNNLMDKFAVAVKEMNWELLVIFRWENLANLRRRFFIS